MRNEQASSQLGSVDRALRLIMMLQAGETVSVTEAAARLDVAPSTAHRLLGALSYRGFAIQDAARRYSIGPALAAHAATVTTATLRSAASPALAALRQAFQETAHLMVLRGTLIQFVDGVEADRALRIGLRIGGTMPAYCSAGGKAMLAALSTPEVEALHAAGLPEWPTAKIRSLTDLKRQLAEIRQTSYGVQIEETEAGVCGVGAAILDLTGRPVAGLTLALPVGRFDRRSVPAMGRLLTQVAAETADRLYGGATPLAPGQSLSSAKSG
jgi:IclR family acetate operon transcriptional repressor